MALRALALLAFALLAACATSGVGNPASATGGTYVDCSVTDGDELKAVHWIVSPDGTIEFGGGRDAMNNTMTWKGKMSQQEIDALRALLEDDGWYAGTVAGTGTPKNRNVHVVVKYSDGTRKFNIQGRCDEADRLEALLQRASAGRLDPYLKKLPAASAA